MSDPNNVVPDDAATVDAPGSDAEEPQSVELDVDREKLDAWDEVKSDYQVDPDSKAAPNNMAATQHEAAEDDPDSQRG
jgi:hypothetical protein